MNMDTNRVKGVVPVGVFCTNCIFLDNKKQLCTEFNKLLQRNFYNHQTEKDIECLRGSINKIS